MARIGSLVVTLYLAATLAAPARGELVLLEGGHVLKVTDYEVGPRQARLTLANGGVLTLSVLRIVRIVEDEITTDPPPSRPSLRLYFREDARAPETPYAELIFAAARTSGLDPALVAAVVRVESAFDPHAVSGKGARGLMQLMPATAARFGVSVEELFEPVRNLAAGAAYLRWLVDRYREDAVLVLAAYNAGEGSVTRYGGVPPYRETREYVARVLRLLTPEAAVGSR